MHGSVRPRPVEPIYFGSSNRQLFGCFHAPSSGSTRDCGVVLCYPVGEEYIRFHRAYRLLSDHLAEAGFPVLRFDFYGCGDSSGELEQGQVSHWCADIATAVAEARRRGNVTKICLVGLRLGGSMSLLVGTEWADIDGMVLLDPVVSGRDYLEELRSSHRKMLRHAHVKLKRGPLAERGERAEILGFPLTASMRLDLETLDLLAVRQKPANKILIIESNEKIGQGRLVEHLRSQATNLTFQRLPAPRLWVWEEAVGRVLVPRQILQSVVSWLSEVYT